MLRSFFGESERAVDSYIKQCNDILSRTLQLLEQYPLKKARQDGAAVFRYDWATKGFIRSLDELEQSIYSSTKLAVGLHVIGASNTPEQQEQYNLFLYFYKNSFIRVFSLLDKLGYFMNDYFGVQTEQVKSKFSYFTVLRQLEQRDDYDSLVKELKQWKNLYNVPMQRLRTKRNMEIHVMNVEFQGDAEHQTIHSIQLELQDLDQGYRMACRSLHSIYSYVAQQLDR